MLASTRGVTAFPKLADAESLVAAGRFEQAARGVMEHLRAHPNEPRGLALLGSIAISLGALGQAEQFLRRAMALGQNGTDVQRNLASALNQQERLPEALELFDRLRTASDDPSIDAIRALILDKLARNEEALAVLGHLVERHPDQPPFWISYGHSLRAAGSTDEAIAAYRRATEIDFECGEAWWGLANIKSKILTDDDMATMERALAIAVDDRNIAPLHFSIARGRHDRKEYDRAFDHYSQGNRLRAEQIGYRSQELTDEVDQSIRSIDRTGFGDATPRPNQHPTPIFIISLPRSGSTLLEQMLGSHSDIEPIGELPYVPALLRSVMEVHTRRGQITVPELVNRLDPAEATAIGTEYLRRAALHRARDTGAFLDKLPHNWSNILFIRRILPQAKFIDIRRSAMDCCFSNFTQSFSRAHAASFALRDIGQCYVDNVRLMDHLATAAPDLVHHVSYEQLIEQPETELRAIFNYLGLEWENAPLNFHQLDRVVRTPSAEQVRRPLNREGVDTWLPYAQWLGPLREALGKLAIDVDQ